MRVRGCGYASLLAAFNRPDARVASCTSDGQHTHALGTVSVLRVLKECPEGQQRIIAPWSINEVLGKHDLHTESALW